jgi:general stress protein YciG
MPESEKGEISVREAGRRGGSKVREKYGREFYEKIGKVGGKKGGNTTKERYGPDYYKKIGTMGGQRVKELIERAKQSAE